MKILKTDLGKVSITAEGTWDSTKTYERLTIVDDGKYASYMSKHNVPANTPLSNTKYWQPIAALSALLVQDIDVYKKTLGLVSNFKWLEFNNDFRTTVLKLKEEERHKGLWIAYISPLYTGGECTFKIYYGNSVIDDDFGNDDNWFTLNDIMLSRSGDNLTFKKSDGSTAVIIDSKNKDEYISIGGLKPTHTVTLQNTETQVTAVIRFNSIQDTPYTWTTLHAYLLNNRILATGYATDLMDAVVSVIGTNEPEDIIVSTTGNGGFGVTFMPDSTILTDVIS
jgi:hypothetical protein